MKIIDKLPKKIDAVVFDFDGVFTENRVYLSEDGKEMVCCNRSDGWGIGNLHKAKIKMDKALKRIDSPIESTETPK